MINQVLKRFKELFTERCDKFPLLDFGEDSVRYDFFIAISEVEKLKPSDIQIEFPMGNQSFIPRMNIKSKRKEKPQLDLVIDKGNLRISVEFALFRQNSNFEGNINKTARTVKMINDMIRLGIDSYYTKRKAYFICVADDKMIGHKLRSGILGKFPSDYEISRKLVEQQREIKTSAFDDRFINKFNEMNFEFNAKLIFNEEVKAREIKGETRILVWEIMNV